jgi:Glucodextranase, domain B
MWKGWPAVFAALLFTGCAAEVTSTTTHAASTTVQTTTTTTSSTIATTTSPMTTTSMPTAPPMLEITDPGFGATVTDAVYPFRGVTDPGCTVTVGGKYVADVAADGRWTLRLGLGPGRNSTTFVATDPTTGQQTAKATRVYYAEPPGQVGHLVRAIWDDPGLLQQYYVDGEPTGYYTGARLPLVWSGDFVSLEVGLSTKDASIPLRTYDTDFAGLITLLEPVGNEYYLVHDEQPVMIAAGTGILAAMCPVDDIPHLVTLGFTDHGLAPVQAWRIDLDGNSLVEVAVDGLPCPDLADRSVGDDEIGAIVTIGRCAVDGSCNHYLSLSSEGAAATRFWDFGGTMLESVGYYPAAAVSVVSTDPQAVSPELLHTRLWLQEWIGWDWSGMPIWRIADSTPVADHPISFQCSVDGGGQAFAEIESWTSLVPVKAWTVSPDLSRFEEVSPTDAQCWTEGD